MSDEGRGLDFVLEILVSGERQKDCERNVERYARLGIPEYFVDLPRERCLTGYALLGEARAYEPILPQGGRWRSNVLDLELALEGERLRFYSGTGPLPDARELIDKVSAMIDESVSRAEAEAERAERLAAKLRELGVDPDSIV